MNTILDAAKTIGNLFGKGTGQLFIVLGVTVWLTVWIGLRIRDVELSLDKRFKAIEKQNEYNWTVQMMAARDRIVAEWNPTNRVPDAWRIFYDIRSGHEPVGIRVGP